MSAYYLIDLIEEKRQLETALDILRGAREEIVTDGWLNDGRMTDHEGE
jgi:hypothetical protein